MKREFEIKWNAPFSSQESIDDMIEELKRVKEKGATHINIESYISYDCAYTEISAVCIREETEEEVAQREEEDRLRLEAKEKSELQMLTELINKYGLP